MAKPPKKRRRLNAKKKWCHCTPQCRAKIGNAQRQRHYNVAPENTIQPSESDESDSASSSNAQVIDPDLDTSVRSNGFSDQSEVGNNSEGSGDSDVHTAEDLLDENQTSYCDDLHSDKVPISPVLSDDEDYDPDDDLEFRFNPEEDIDEEKSLEDMIRDIEESLGPQSAQELHAIRMFSSCISKKKKWLTQFIGNTILTDEDRDSIRAFKMQMMCHMPRKTFEYFRHTFRHKLNVSSEWKIIHRMAILSGIEPVWIDCCVNSCIAYTKSYKNNIDCHHCHEPRYFPNPDSSIKKPRRRFAYLPIIPRLKGYFENPKMVQALKYRSSYEHIPGTYSDVFDGLGYRRLCRKNVEVDGKAYPHRYFSGENDIALSVCTDSYLLYKRRRRGPSATPILFENYNFDPMIRTHLEYLICGGVIPGPHSPKELETFLAPFDDECASLAIGILTYDSLARDQFLLRAYYIAILGDLLTIEKTLCTTGHGGYCPCRSCEIKGFRDVENQATVYYVALTRPHVEGEPNRSWDPNNLPLRTHDSFAKTVKLIENEPLITDKKALTRFYGIKGMPALTRVGSLDFARSVPWDWMHLLLENIIPRLVDLWTDSGRFKGLGTGCEDYAISPEVWEEIGLETENAVKHIPAAFVRVLANIATDRGNFTAESWCFWFIYLAPGLLQGRFQNPKYHTHVCDLTEIMKTTLQYTITEPEIVDLNDKIIVWVQLYEK